MKELFSHTNILKEIISLKEELPTRSSQKIITMLELSKRAEVGLLNIQTVNRILNYYGFTNQALAKQNRVFIKHEEDDINL